MLVEDGSSVVGVVAEGRKSIGLIGDPTMGFLIE